MTSGRSFQSLSLTLLIAAILGTGCASRSYQRLPARYTEIPETVDADSVYVLEVVFPFDSPSGARFEFWDDAGTIRGVRTDYWLGTQPVSKDLTESEARTYLAALQSFDWNNIYDRENGPIFSTDDLIVVFRARIQSLGEESSHEAKIYSFSSSSQIRRILREVDILRPAQ